MSAVKAAGVPSTGAWLQTLGASSAPPSLALSGACLTRARALAPSTVLEPRLAGGAMVGVAVATAATGSSSGRGVQETRLAGGVTAAAAVGGLGAKERRRRRQVTRRGKVTALRQAPLTSDRMPVMPPGRYCEATEKCIRRKTRTVHCGAVKIGSEHPIATQTMANTLTHDVEATVAQIKKCADAGIDIVRVTVQGMREAKACEHIKRRLLEDGYTTPIVADIHFTPKVAMVVADFVDKIRVNPGNFADGRKSFDTITELTPDMIREAQQNIEEDLVPLILKLKAHNKALRIGVNHGSMAERILFQYGDSPEGMVASAVEFGEICRKHDYHNFVFSMKSSNPQVMVQAYRQLARTMYEKGWDYPLHLGVTEAGGGADGRIKSAVGIGALLLDGLGDTVRVSLTEDPEFEAGPCKELRTAAERTHGTGLSTPIEEAPARRSGHFARRRCDYPLDIPLNSDGSVLTTLRAEDLRDVKSPALRDHLGINLRKDGDLQKDWKSVDAVVVEGDITPEVSEKLRELLNVPLGVLCRPGPNIPDGVTLLHNASEVKKDLQERLGGSALVFTGKESAEVVEAAMRHAKPRMVLFRPEQLEGVTFLARRFFATLASLGDSVVPAPVMLWFRYPPAALMHASNADFINYESDLKQKLRLGSIETVGSDAAVVRASAELGSLFVDGLGEGLLWEAASMSGAELREASFNLLQAARMRISKTEFISCPSCGRTLFNLQTVTAKIQARTGHLPGVRVAVMGCIVNGPGEMADADFGYVGSGVGKVDLYVSYDCVRRAVPQDEAVDALVDLIKEHGKWVEPGTGGDEEVQVLGLDLVRDTL